MCRDRRENPVDPQSFAVISARGYESWVTPRNQIGQIAAKCYARAEGAVYYG
jgi:hypothetical protein